ncbi:hypothetical protein [Hyphomicrobium sp. DY-1]|uniref:hypothetical protein n=1 Tax=Hyphomicrobium sp. DY-1 TaxID=3075650 RepID=UPI0039C19416
MFDLDMLNTLAAGGWSELENLQERFGKQAREQGHAENEEIKRQAAIFARTFGTEDGRLALDLLVKMTLLRQPGDDERGAQTAEAYAIAKAKRDGQNSIIFMLLARLQQHGKIKRAAEEQAAADAQAERDRAAAESQNRKRSESSRSRRRPSGGEP